MENIYLLALQTPFWDQWGQLITILVIIAVLWVVVRVIFRMAMRVFTLGCGAILILGFILAALRFLN
jgi:hypothetical protein